MTKTVFWYSAVFLHISGMETALGLVTGYEKGLGYLLYVYYQQSYL